MKIGKHQVHLEHWKKPLTGCAHGPQSWPWWRLFGMLICGRNYDPPGLEYGFRVWIYTRAGGRVIDVRRDWHVA